MTIPHMSHAYLTHGTHAVRANQRCQRTTNQPGKGRVSYTGMQAPRPKLWRFERSKSYCSTSAVGK